jgi:hypothetical protein
MTAYVTDLYKEAVGRDSIILATCDECGAFIRVYGVPQSIAILIE